MPNFLADFERGRMAVMARQQAELQLMRESMDTLIQSETFELRKQAEVQGWNNQILRLEQQSKILPLQHGVEQKELELKGIETQAQLDAAQVTQAVREKLLGQFKAGMEKESTPGFTPELSAERDALRGQLKELEAQPGSDDDLQDELEYLDSQIGLAGKTISERNLPPEREEALAQKQEQLMARRAEVIAALDGRKAAAADMETKRGRIAELDKIEAAPSDATQHYLDLSKALEGSGQADLQALTDSQLSGLYSAAPVGSPDRKAIATARNQAKIRELDKMRSMMSESQIAAFDRSTKGIREKLQSDEDFGAESWTQYKGDLLPKTFQAELEAERTQRPQSQLDPTRPVFDWKSTEQGKAYAFASRLVESQRVLEDLAANANFDPTKMSSQVAAALQNPVNFVWRGTPEEQRYGAAVERWLRAKLRKESGATIAPSEFSGDFNAFFAAVGESGKSLKDKVFAQRNVVQTAITEVGHRDASNFLFDTLEGKYDQRPAASLPGASAIDRATVNNAAAALLGGATPTPVTPQSAPKPSSVAPTTPAPGIRPVAPPVPANGMRPMEILPPGSAGQVPTAPSAKPPATAPAEPKTEPSAAATKTPSGPTKVAFEEGTVTGSVLGKPIKQAPAKVGRQGGKFLKPPVAIVFHSSAATQNQDQLAKAMDSGGKGYHFTINRDGTVAQHWPADSVAYHAREGGYNYRSIGISLVGTDNDKGGGVRYIDSDSRTTLPATKAQLAAAKALVKELQAIYPSIKEFRGHGETDPGNRAKDEGLDVARFLRGEPIDSSKDA